MSKSLIAIISIILILIFSGFIGLVGGEDEFCGWNGFRHDSSNTGATDCEGPESPAVLWTFDLSEEGIGFDNTPIIDPESRSVFIGGYYRDIGQFFALDLYGYYNGADNSTERSTGSNLSSAEVKWWKETDQIQVTSATIDDSNVYFGDSSGILYAADLKTGEEQWRFETGKGSQIHASPVIIDDKILIGTFYDNKLYLLNRSSGDEIWNRSLGERIQATPAVYNGKIYAGFCGSSLDIINLTTGEVNQKFACTSPIISSPSIYKNNVYFGNSDGIFYSMNASNNEENWNISIGSGIFSSPAVFNDKIFIGADDGFVYAFNYENGSIVWKFQTGNMVRSSPAVADGIVYIGSSDGFLYALEAESGNLSWKHDTGSPIEGSPAIADGILIVATTGGKVIAFGEVDVTAPAVLSTQPARDEIKTPLNTTISLNFSVPMDRLSVEDNLTISPEINYNLSWINNTLFIIPNATLLEGTNYTITVGANTMDRIGNVLGSEYNWSFHTRSKDNGGGNGNGNGNGGTGQIIDEDEPDEDSIVYKLTPVLEIVFIILVLLLVVTLIAYGIWFVKKNR